MRGQYKHTPEDWGGAEEYLSRLGRLVEKVEARAEYITVMQTLKAATERANPEESKRIEALIGAENVSLRADVEEMIRAGAEIRETISRVDDAQLKTLLELRFVGCMTWEAVAERMDYERRQIFRKRKAALDAVAEILKHVTECHCRVEI